MTAKQPLNHQPKAAGSITVDTRLGKLVLPSPLNLPSNAYRASRKNLNPVDTFFDWIEAAFKEGSRELKIIDGLTLEEAIEVNNAWLDGVSAGESLNSES